MGKEIFCRFPCKNDDLTIHLGYAILDAGVGINFIDHFNARELILKFFHGNDESLVVLGFLYSNLKNRIALQMTGMSYLSRRGLNYKAFDTLFSVHRFLWRAFEEQLRVYALLELCVDEKSTWVEVLLVLNKRSTG